MSQYSISILAITLQQAWGLITGVGHTKTRQQQQSAQHAPEHTHDDDR